MLGPSVSQKGNSQLGGTQGFLHSDVRRVGLLKLNSHFDGRADVISLLPVESRPISGYFYIIPAREYLVLGGS